MMVLALLQESSKNIQMEAFHVFKVYDTDWLIHTCAAVYFSISLFISAYCQLFAANKEKPPEIISILVANRSKLLRFFSDFKMDKGGPEKEAFLLPSLLVLFDAFHL